MFYSHIKSISIKIPVLPIEKFPLFSGIRECHNALLSYFLSITCQVVAYGRLKRKFQTISPKSGTSRSLTRGGLHRGFDCNPKRSVFIVL